VRQYLAGNADIDDIRARPLQAAEFSGLPPALVMTAEFDPIRDDGRRYACRLIEAGNNCEYREAKGMIHGYFRARFMSQEVDRELDHAAGFLKRLLT
jgi:acetyl esterase